MTKPFDDMERELSEIVHTLASRHARADYRGELESLMTLKELRRSIEMRLMFGRAVAADDMIQANENPHE